MTTERRPYVATMDDRSQVLIEIWLDDGEIGTVSVALRDRPQAVWGPPYEALDGRMR